MLYVIVCTIFVLCMLSQTSSLANAEHQAYHEECMESSGVDPDVLEEAYKGNVAEDDDELKDYISCLFKKSGFLDGNGEMKHDAFKTLLPQVGVDAHLLEVEGVHEGETVVACKKTVGATSSETAFLNFKCYIKMSLPKPHFLF